MTISVLKSPVQYTVSSFDVLNAVLFYHRTHIVQIKELRCELSELNFRIAQREREKERLTELLADSNRMLMVLSYG